MRTVTLPLIAALCLGGMNTARAADLDYDYLRGAEYEPAPVSVIDWSGVYLGGHGGYTSAALGFTNATRPLILGMSHDTVAESEFGASSLLQLPRKRVGDASFGGFAGYNIQIDGFVFGFEADYTSFGRTGVADGFVSRTKVNATGNQQFVAIDGASATRVNDIGTFRARAGYAIGNFLPFVTGGFAIGRARIADAVAYSDVSIDVKAANARLAGMPIYDSSTYFGHYATQSRTKVVGGATVGAGLEYAITPNIILRGEYQYVLLNDMDGHKVNLNTVRGGAAVKF